MLKKEKNKVKPFLKWVGGKSQLINVIDSKLPLELKEGNITEYFEPFVGGGALFFHLMTNYNIEKTYISDYNKDLILTYNTIKKDPKKLINKLKELKSNYIPLEQEDRKKNYYGIRNKFNTLKDNIDYEKYSKDHVLHASYFIFMNKTCFNGIYRVNSKGYFNVPMGRYKNPSIYDEKNILAVSKILKNTEINNNSFEMTEDLITDNSFVYLDPPYRPITKTSFTNYTKSNFNDKNQIKLSEYYKRISKKGAKVLLSNSDPKNMDKNDNFFDKLYSDFKIERTLAKRHINRDGSKRGPISEILIRNY